MKNKDLFYVRYVDDFVFLTKEKEDLINIKNEILEFLKEKLKLSVSPKKLILNKISCSIPFLGYNILPNRLKIRNDTIKRFKKKIKNYSIEKKINSLISFKGHCDLSNRFLIKSLTKNLLLEDMHNNYKYKESLKILYGTSTRDIDKRHRQEKWTKINLSIFHIPFHV